MALLKYNILLISRFFRINLPIIKNSLKITKKCLINEITSFILMPIQSTPDNANLEGKLKKVRVIELSGIWVFGSLKQMTVNKENTMFTVLLFIQGTF